MNYIFLQEEHLCAVQLEVTSWIRRLRALPRSNPPLEVIFLLSMLCNPAASSLTSDSLTQPSLFFLLAPLGVTHIFSVLPEALPSLTCNALSPEPLLPLALLSLPPLSQIRLWSLPCLCPPSQGGASSPFHPPTQMLRALTRHKVGEDRWGFISIQKDFI